MDTTLDAEHGALIQFLYLAPIGLLQASMDGEITMINPMSAQLRMPMAPGGDLGNLFEGGQSVAPQLRARALAAPYPGGEVCDGLLVATRAAAPGETVPPAPTRDVRQALQASGLQPACLQTSLRLWRRRMPVRTHTPACSTRRHPWTTR